MAALFHSVNASQNQGATKLSNERYLRKHPEVAMMLRLFMFEVRFSITHVAGSQPVT